MLEYSGNKLVIQKPTCDCTYHKMPDTNIYIGKGILESAVSYIKNHIDGKKCMIVTDDNLYELFGKSLCNILSSEYEVYVSIPPSEKELKPDNAALGFIMMELLPETDFMVALGSGTVNDLVRYASSLVGKPFVSIGTAPSMDGYVSVISPMLKGNLKINIPADYPVVGIYDLEILSTAPPEMMFAGFGDVIGKYIAKADWILSSYVTGEKVCPYCIDLSEKAIEIVLENLDEIAACSPEGAGALLEALLLTGLAMLINTNSRPAASNEHNMGHFWEMKKLAEGKPHPSHGEAVGIATLYCLAFYKEVLSLDTATIDVETLPLGNFDTSVRERVLLEVYGETVGRSIIDDNPDEPVSLDERKKRVRNYIDNIDRIQDALSFLPSYKEIVGIYRKLKGPENAGQIGIEPSLLKDALLYAKDYRDRYNVFKTADELGILDETVENILDIL